MMPAFSPVCVDGMREERVSSVNEIAQPGRGGRIWENGKAGSRLGAENPQPPRLKKQRVAFVSTWDFREGKHYMRTYIVHT
jgi:hypothetical protein